jgi:hypothetical protein
VTAAYAGVLIAGLIMLVGWIIGTTVGETVDGWEWIDPERRFGVAGRRIVGAAVGFGMGGMSATFAGWAWPIVAAAAVGGAGVLALLAGVFGPES